MQIQKLYVLAFKNVIKCALIFSLLGANCLVIQFALDHFVPLNRFFNSCLDSEFLRTELKMGVLVYSMQRECSQGGARRYDVVVQNEGHGFRVARILDATNTRLKHRINDRGGVDIFVDGGGRLIECGNGINEVTVHCYMDGELQVNSRLSGAMKFSLVILSFIVFQIISLFGLRKRL